MKVLSSMLTPEILAPAGNLLSVYTAIKAGADAVYFGVDGQFNARAKSDGISSDALAEVVHRCHRAGVKALVTVNTLVFEAELTRVSMLIEHIAKAGVDALIVQDPAVALLAREIAPNLEVHASTQMTVSSPEAARFAKRLGVTRVVVPRELTVGQIKKFKDQTDLELEVFIHGALCMSWSGQCLTSEAWGGRSANRGQCAQSCRMPYDLIVDGEERPLGDIKYLLSPRDLAGVRAVESLMHIGVECLKIEGRYKGPAYVKQSIETYQGWIRSIATGQAQVTEVKEQLAKDLTGLSLTYSRGFSDGFLGGSDHQSLVEGRFPKHRGVFLGYVVEVNQEWIRVSTQGDGRKYNQSAQGYRSDPLPLYTPHSTEEEGQDHGEHLRERGPALSSLNLEPGMGVVFDNGEPESEEYGGRIAELQHHNQGTSMRLYQPQNKRLSDAVVKVGQRVWVNNDPTQQVQAGREAKKVGEQDYGRLPLALEVKGDLGGPLSVTATLHTKIKRYHLLSVTHETTQVLSPNMTHPLSLEIIKNKLTGFGGTPFHLQELKVSIANSCGVPVSALKKLRRALVSDLIAKLNEQQAHPIKASALMALQTLKQISANPSSIKSTLNNHHPFKPQLIPLCRTLEQLEAVIAYTTDYPDGGIGEVELDWMEFIGLRQAVERARKAGLKVTIATVRVQKPGESGYDQRIASLKPDGVLIRHWGALTHFASLPEEDRPILHGDYALNVTNSLTAHHVLQYGLHSLTASHDLDAKQLLNMLSSFPASAITVTIHHHIPTFHTEHCVYAHLLSDGRDFKTCGRPCEAHRVALKDHKGQAHPVLVDVECRNTVFNAAAQTAARLVKDLVKERIARLRLEFVWENFEQTQRVILAYQELLDAKITPETVLERLGTHERFGLTTGTMEVSQ